MTRPSIGAMCGRFVSSSSPDQIATYFDVDAVSEQLLDRGPNFNTAPTTPVFVVLDDGTSRRLDAFHWGLVPFWAKDTKIGNRMINARAETVAEKSAFKRSLAKRRCIIPADGFYEWQHGPGDRRRSSRSSSTVPTVSRYAFAGLWEEWKGPKDAPKKETDADLPPVEPLRSTTIITTSANETHVGAPRPHAGDPAPLGVGPVARPGGDTTSS